MLKRRASCLSCAYLLSLVALQASGGLVVSFLYDTVGWRWVSIGAASIAGLALVYNSLLPSPSLREAGPKLKSEGVLNALCSAEFAGHAWTAFNMGWSMNVHIFVVVLALKQNFAFSPRSIGFCFLLVPAGILPTVFLLPRLTRRFGLHACITSGCLANVTLCALLSIPALHNRSLVVILGLGLGMFVTFMQHNSNQARAKLIAAKYAKNATGAVTGVSRTCFALGQAIGPLVSGLIWSWSVSGPFIVLAVIQLSQIVLMLVTRTPLWRDPIAKKVPALVSQSEVHDEFLEPAMPGSMGSVLNLTLMDKAAEHDASGSNGTSACAEFEFSLDSVRAAPTAEHGDSDDLDTIHIKAGEDAISNGNPAPITCHSYSRHAAPSTMRPSSKLRSRRSTHDLVYGRARVAATFSSVPSQRSASSGGMGV